MLTVWKMELRPEHNTYLVPKGAKILSVGLQRGTAQMWFLCDERATEKETRRIVFVGTGHPIEDHGALKFIGTIMTGDQSLVFHVFERVDAWY